MFCSLFVYNFINVFFYSIQWSNLIFLCFLSSYVYMIPTVCVVAFFVTFYSHHVKLKVTSKN